VEQDWTGVVKMCCKNIAGQDSMILAWSAQESNRQGRAWFEWNN
jgi:hypothetical protein